MIYEINKALAGFRLKLIFHSNLKKDNAYIYVDVRETPTIGDMVNNIATRFNISLNLSVFLDNAIILESENIRVLADVDEVLVSLCSEKNATELEQKLSLLNSPSTTAELTNHDTKQNKRDTERFTSNTTCVKRYPTISVNENETSVNKPCKKKKKKTSNMENSPNNFDEIEKSESVFSSANWCNMKSQSMDQKGTEKSKSDFFKNENNKILNVKDAIYDLKQTDTTENKREYDKKQVTMNIREEPEEVTVAKNFYKRGLAGFLQQLREEQNSSEINQSTKQWESMSCEDSAVHEFNVAGNNINDTEIDDSSDISWEKKKRKRKRKNFKRIIENEVPVVKTDSHPTKIPLVNSLPRIHIYFNDDEDTNDEPVKKQSNETKMQKINSESAPYTSDIDKSRQQLEVIASENNDEKHLDFFKEQIPDLKTSKSIFHSQNVQNVIQPPVFNPTIKPTSVANQFENEQQLGTLLMCKELKTVCQYNVQFPSDRTASTPKLFDISSSALNKSNLEVNRIQNDSSKLAENSLLSPKTNKTVSDSEHLQNSNVSTNGLKKNISIEMNIGKQLPEIKANQSCNKRTDSDNSSHSSDECELLFQFKIDGYNIYFRSDTRGWIILTPEIAGIKLPEVDVPKKDQSVVFTILYLKYGMVPTESEFLIFGRVLKYAPDINKVALQIPRPFIEKLCMDGTEEPALPDGISFISENVYELDWLVVRNPRRLS